MNQVGDGASQPTEGEVTLDDIASAMTAESETPDESEEAPEEAEVDQPEEEEDDDPGEDEEEEPKFTIKVDGKEIELTKSELIERAQKGTDYTQKTMAVAAEREAVQAERERAESYRAEVEKANSEALARLEAYTKYIETQVGQMPDAAMLDYDTAGYLRQKEQYEARKGQLHQAYSAAQQLQQEQARQRQAWIAEKAASTEKALRDTLPGWSDDTLNALASYAETLGLTPKSAELAMLEPGFWALAHKAKAYDAIQEKKASMKPTEKLAKVIKPVANNTSSKVADRAKREAAFNKNPSVESLADLL